MPTAPRVARAPAAPKRGPASRRPSLAESVYRQVKEGIFEFRLLPGDRFSEGEIATWLEVSRTPVREALLRLEREGWLSVHYRSGWSVRELDFTQFDELYDLRIVLETASVRVLCEQADQPALDGLKAAWLIPDAERLADGAAVCALDEAFHAHLVDAAGNREISRCHREVTERIRILRRLDFTESHRVAATYREHGQILQAILRRRADQATMLLRVHVETSKAEVRKISLHKLYIARRA